MSKGLTSGIPEHRQADAGKLAHRANLSRPRHPRQYPGPLALSLMALLLTGCTQGEDYRRPSLPVASGWEAPLPPPESGKTPAAAMQAPRAPTTGQLVSWWDRLQDPVLTRLLQMAEADSPGLAEAWANISMARATITTAGASGLPSLTAGASGQRQRQGTGGKTTTTNTVSGSLDASWELDLWGKVQRTREAAEARLAARTSDWHDARVSLAAEVADTYASTLACRQLVEVYRAEVQSQQETADSITRAVEAGFTAPADGALAVASAATARSGLTSQQASCDVLVKALAALTGSGEPSLRVLLQQAPARLDEAARFEVDSVPAALLSRRPDLVSLERELAASTAEMGAAEADRWPSLSLSGTISRAGTSLGSLATGWLLGPAASLPLFDGGQRAAAVDSARAARDAAFARYRQGVRTAVQEVEQALVELDSASRRTRDADIASTGYRRYFDAINRNWRAGGASLLDREEARRQALAAELTAITVRREQISAWITLYKALGGGWQAGDDGSLPPATPPAQPSSGQSSPDQPSPDQSSPDQQSPDQPSPARTSGAPA